MDSKDYGVKFESITVAKLTGLEKDSISEARKAYNRNREKPVKLMEFRKMLLVTGAERILCGGGND
jgi:hypothetical protein